MGLSNNFSPIATVVISYIMLRDKIKREDLILMCVVITGLLIITVPGLIGAQGSLHV